MADLIPCYLKDAALLDDIENLRGRPGLRLWWLGQSGFLMQVGGRHLLFDPYLSDSLTRKYSGTDKPHVRMTERAVDPARLGFVDVVTSSHNHTDHLDGETINAVRRASGDVKVVVAAANREFAAERLGMERGELVTVDVGEPVTVAVFEIHAVPAAHEAVERDGQGRCVYVGYVVRCGEYGVYHSGDTVMYEGMAEVLRPFGVEVALLPLTGRRAERRVAGNLFGDEAARLAKEIGAKVAVPCHYEMFEFNTETPDLFEETCRSLGQGYRVLRCGERLDYPSRG